jgi:hypothetical protein
MSKGKYNKIEGNTKKCPKCGLVKVLDEYYHRTEGGVFSYCKSCTIKRTSLRDRREEKKRYYQTHKQQFHDRWAGYYKKNNGKMNAYRTAYAQRRCLERIVDLEAKLERMKKRYYKAIKANESKENI